MTVLHQQSKFTYCDRNHIACGRSNKEDSAEDEEVNLEGILGCILVKKSRQTKLIFSCF